MLYKIYATLVLLTAVYLLIPGLAIANATLSDNFDDNKLDPSK